MLSLIISIFRTKIKIYLSILIFSLLFIILSSVISSYYININNINTIKNKEENRRIFVTISDNNTIDVIEKIKHIEKIQKKEIFNDEIIYILTVDNKTNVDNVINQLRDNKFEYNVVENNDSEIKTCEELEIFYKFLTFFLVIVLLLISIIQSILLIIWEEKNIYILKVLGYSNNKIAIIELIKILFIYVLAIAISYLVNSICNHNNIIMKLIFLSVFFLIIQYPIFMVKINKINYNTSR